jgi:hypothetical protein
MSTGPQFRILEGKSNDNSNRLARKNLRAFAGSRALPIVPEGANFPMGTMPQLWQDLLTRPYPAEIDNTDKP